MNIRKKRNVFPSLLALALIYIGYVSWLNTNRPRFQLQSVQQEKIASPSQFDTQINVVVNDNRWFFTRWSEGVNISLKNQHIRYVDEKGRILEAKIPYGFKLNTIRNRCFITHQFSLAQLPKSAKRVIFTSSIVANDLAKEPSAAVKLPVRVEMKQT